MTIIMKQLPRKILEKAIQLKNCQKNIYITLYSIGKPSTAQEVADLIGQQRAYVHMRLLQLTEKGLVKQNRRGKAKKLFEVVS